METIILVSVLSTLGVVAIALAFVVAFKKLNGKVDVRDAETIYQNIEEVSNNLDNRLNESEQNVHQIIDGLSNELNLQLEEGNRNLDGVIRGLEENFSKDFESVYRTVDSNEQAHQQNIDEVHRTIDSRCDKLYDSINK